MTTNNGYAVVPPPPPYAPAADIPAPLAPRPAFEFENQPTPAASVPAFKQSTAAEEQQRRTAELLAQYQRRYASANPTTGFATITTTASSTTLQTVPATYTVQSAPVTTVMSDAPSSYARTDYYAGDFTGGNAAVPPMPQSARAGECFALVKTPEQYRSVQQSYVSRPGYDQVHITPARYQSTNQDYIAQEAYERLEIMPATFKTLTERVEVSPPSVRMASSEPVYETVSERVIERPARQVWKRGHGPKERIDNATGEIMCLVEEPAVYRTVTRQVLKQQPQVREVQIPGEYRTVTRRVIDQPAQVRRVVVPEQRSSMTVQKLVEPARYDTVRVPDQMSNVTIRELAAPSTLEWRPVLCETNITRGNVVARVQDALRSNGFNPGPTDGRVGNKTWAALNAYQRSKGLPEDRYLNLATLESLGIGYN